MIHNGIKDRQKWLNELWEWVKSQTDDDEVALIQYEKLVFEE